MAGTGSPIKPAGPMTLKGFWVTLFFVVVCIGGVLFLLLNAPPDHSPDVANGSTIRATSGAGPNTHQATHRPIKSAQ